MDPEFAAALKDLLENMGAHPGECTFGPACSECGQRTGQCTKHAEAFAARQRRLRNAMAIVGIA